MEFIKVLAELLERYGFPFVSAAILLYIFIRMQREMAEFHKVLLPMTSEAKARAAFAFVKHLRSLNGEATAHDVEAAVTRYMPYLSRLEREVLIALVVEEITKPREERSYWRILTKVADLLGIIY